MTKSKVKKQKYEKIEAGNDEAWQCIVYSILDGTTTSITIKIPLLVITKNIEKAVVLDILLRNHPSLYEEENKSNKINISPLEISEALFTPIERITSILDEFKNNDLIKIKDKKGYLEIEINFAEIVIRLSPFLKAIEETMDKESKENKVIKEFIKSSKEYIEKNEEVE